MKKNQLIQIPTSDGLYLHGYYVTSESKETVVLHIHGFQGNFYENSFIYALANELESQNIGFLSVNTRGNGRDSDFNTVSGEIKRIGACYELLEEAHLDISAWIEFLIKEGYKKITLQGHSLGTIKAVRYLFEGKHKAKIDKLILLAPFDKKALMVNSGRTDIQELLDKAALKVAEGKGEEIITTEFEDIEVSYKTFISWYQQDDLGRMFEFCSSDYDFPILKKINIPTKIIVGSEDEYFHQSNPEHPEEAMEILLKNIPNAKGKLIKHAPHSFVPYEGELANEVSLFVTGNL
jgi:pimeloyl-ACP methyl ester carboxylesterase